MKKAFRLLPLVFLLSACTSFVPAYHKPKVDIPQNWSDNPARAEQTDISAQLNWRNFYRDARLQKLIAMALLYNHDLKQAALNIELAAAQYDIQKASDAPTVGLNGGFTRKRTPRDLAGRSSVRDAYNVGAGMASFEIDFFGRVRALKEAALLNYLSTYEARDAAQLSLIAAVAKTYQQARIARAQMDLAQNVVTSRQKSHRLTQLLTDAGVATAQDLSGVSAQIEAARANFATAERGYQQALNALSRLVGKPLDEIDLPPAASLNKQFGALRLPAGIASEVLQVRPDIRAVEYQLKAANANIGAARAALYPNISLTGNLGFGSVELGKLLRHANILWSIAPSVNFPIFDGQRRQNGVKISKARQQQALQNYQKVVQNAFYDVADALAAKKSLSKQYAAQQKGYREVSNRLRLIRLRLQHGVSTGLDLLDAERENYAAAQGLLATQLQMLNNQIDLFTALGGGLEKYNVHLPTLDKK